MGAAPIRCWPSGWIDIESTGCADAPHPTLTGHLLPQGEKGILGKRIGTDRLRPVIHRQRPPDGRGGAFGAGVAFAQAAGRADGCDLGLLQVKAARIDQAVGVFQLAAQADSQVLSFGEGVLTLTVDGASQGEPCLLYTSPSPRD